MGGRGGGSGQNLGGGSGKNINILNQTDVWSARHNPNNADYVDAINTSVSRIQNDFPGIMDDVNEVNSATLGGADRDGVLGFYDPQAKTVALNERYTDIRTMNDTYDASVASGYHPGRGDRTGTEAVALHEMGHALTDHLGKKLGATDIDDAAKQIVDNAYKNSGGRGGTVAFAKKISGYATESNAECIAEAVADWYCNGNKASSNSKAIIREMQRINNS